MKKSVFCAALMMAAMLLLCGGEAQAATSSRLTWKSISNHMLQAQETPILVDSADYYYK